MDAQLILKIAGIGILVAVVCQILNKAGRDEQAMLVSIAGIVIVLIIIMDTVSSLLSTVKSIFG